MPLAINEASPAPRVQAALSIASDERLGAASSSARVADSGEGLAAVAAWRALARTIHRNRRPGRIHRTMHLATATLFPARVILAAIKRTSRLGPGLLQRGGPARWRQFVHQIDLALRHGLWPEDYYRYHLYRPEPRRDAAEYLSEGEFLVVVRKLNNNSDGATLDDKRRFAAACVSLGLPHVRVIAYFEQGKIAEGSIEQLPQDDLYIKCTRLQCGVGVEHWRWIADRAAFEREGIALSAHELMQRLARDTESMAAAGQRTELYQMTGGYLVQQRVRNHALLSGFSDAALCTARIVTVFPRGGTPAYASGVLRMPVGGNCVDNFSAGGLAAPIDAETGVLGSARSDNLHHRMLHVHPDRGALITGTQLPFWKEARHLCVRAHGHFRKLGVVGWDVGLTPDGPVLLEANPFMGGDVLQIIHGVPLGRTMIPAAVMSHAKGLYER